MSRFDNLIKELCPEGVSYRKIGEIAEVGTGSSNGNEAIEDGVYPFFVRSQTIKAKNDFEYDEEAIIIPGEGGIGEIFHYINGKYALHQRVYRIHFATDDVNVKFAYYYMQAHFKTFIMKKAVNATVTSIRKPMVEDFLLPLPPLQVQSEIVRILDEFTSLTAELTTELSSELAKRKKQYEYYIDELLKPKKETPMFPMGVLFDFRNGLSKGKEFFGTGIPFIRYTDVYNNRSLKAENITALVECTDTELEKLRVSKGDVLFTRTSETAEDVGWSSVMLDDMDACVFNGFTIKATPKTDYLLPEYCKYCFSTKEFRQYVTSHCAFTTRASLTGKTISEFLLPVPSMDEQRKIADILNKLQSICIGLSNGLSAEIEARQKQYEYYRDKLLTFTAKE